MKAVFKKSDILKAMSALLPATDKRAIPILRMVKVEPKKDCLLLTATDFNVRMEYKVPAKIEKPEAICLNAEHLAKMAKAVQGDVVELAFSGSGRARISGGNIGYGMGVMPIDNFPATKPKIKEYVELKSTDLLDAMHKTAFAGADDSSRFFAGGIYINEGEVVSTDGMRLSLVEAPWSKNIKKTLIVAEAARIIMNSLPAGIDIKLGYSESEIAIITDTFRFSYKKVAKEFPAYKAIIPTDDLLIGGISVSSDTLKNSIIAISAITEKESVVTISVKDGETSLSAEGNQSDVFVNLVSTADSIFNAEVTVKASLLRDLTAKAKGDIILRIPKDTKTPLVIEVGKGWKYVVASSQKGRQ